jgi:diguanylate cyclase (GGDEF)-like protein
MLMGRQLTRDFRPPTRSMLPITLRPPSLPLLRNGGAVAALVLLALISRLTQVDGVPPIWLSTGLACALALRWGWSVLPGLWLGSVLGALPAQAMPGALAIGSLLCVEPFMVLLAARWLRQRDVFHALPKLLVFLFACWLGGVLSTLLAGVVPGGVVGMPPAFSRMVGLLTVAPLVLVGLDASRREQLQDFRRWDWWLLLAAVLLNWSLIQGGMIPQLLPTPLAVILPLLVMAAFRFQPLGVAAILCLLAVVELWIPLQVGAGGVERFNGLGLMTMQRLVIYAQFIALVVVVANQERRLLLAGLQAQALRLERQVEERTRALQAANVRLERLSRHDSLTGIANRRSFEQVLQQEWARAQQAGHPLTVVVFDVDHFKAYNDHYGHPAGDRVLRRVARSLAAGFSPAERHRIARYGGEEFVLVLRGLAEAEAVELAETLRNAVTTLAIPHELGGSAGVVTLSGGLATGAAQPGKAPKEVVAAADTMLYAAKAAGRNRLCVHPSGPLA